MVRKLAFALVFATTLGTSLYAQRRRFSWQDACFNNLAAPYCAGHDFAIKPTRPEKNPSPASILRNPMAPSAQRVTPAMTVVGGIDWRFADPMADALVGFNLGGLTA